MVRIGDLRDVVSLLLILSGLLLVLGAVSGFLVQVHPSMPDLALVFAFGIVIWRAGRAVRSGSAFGYWLAVVALALFIVAPWLIGTRRSPVGLLAELAFLALVAVSWWRDSHRPAA